MRRLLLFLLVVMLVLVAGDRLAAHLAAGEAERRLTAHGFTSPSVEVHGFPFVTQLLDRDFTELTVRADAVQVDDGRAEDVDAVLRDVRVPKTGSARVGQLTASGTVPFSVVSQFSGLPSLRLGPAPAGQVRLTATVEVLGQDFSVAARARVRVTETRLRIVPTDVQLEGGRAIDDQLSRLLADRIAVDYPIADLPSGARVDQVTVTDAGFLVHVSGRDVVIPQR